MIYKEKKFEEIHPKVSVFIFTYNQKDIVHSAIEGVLNQKCNFIYELIIVDDCSSDGTLDVCLKYLNQYPHIIAVVQNNKNLGIRDSYFSNISLFARGKYIASCAGDDWWIDENKLSKQVAVFEGDSDCTMVHTLAKVYLDSLHKYSHRLIGSNRNSFRECVLNNGVAALTICYTRDSYERFVKEVHPMELPYSEDYPMVLWHSYRGKIFFLNDITSVYRFQLNSLSHTNDIIKIYRGPKDAYECKKHFISLFGIEDKDLIQKVHLKFCIDRMRWAAFLKDSRQVQENTDFFISNSFYLLYVLQFMYAFVGRNRILNKIVYLMERCIRKVYPIFK